MADIETIVVADDDEQILEITCEFLELSGYNVFTAKDGLAALEVCRNLDRTIHLLITDVVMPGMSGKTLAETLKKDRPEIKVLYTSGYTDDTMVDSGALDEGVPFLRKPYFIDSLIKKVREVLDT